MRYFKVNMSSGDPVRIAEDELVVVVEAIAKRTPAVVCRSGVLNSAFYVSITVDKERERDEGERERLGIKGESDASPFARILGGRMKQIGSGNKTES